MSTGAFGNNVTVTNVNKDKQFGKCEGRPASQVDVNEWHNRSHVYKQYHKRKELMMPVEQEICFD